MKTPRDPALTAQVPRPFLYLDVDGVLLADRDPGPRADPGGRGGGAPAPASHVEEFLAYCAAEFDCRWLTTHAHEGDAEPVMCYLARHAGEAVLASAARVKPTVWRTLKTEAIDLGSDFYVIDDGLLQAEQEVLRAHGVLHRWIQADTRERPEDLKRVLALLKEKKAQARGRP